MWHQHQVPWELVKAINFQFHPRSESETQINIKKKEREKFWYLYMGKSAATLVNKLKYNISAISRCNQCFIFLSIQKSHALPLSTYYRAPLIFWLVLWWTGLAPLPVLWGSRTDKIHVSNKDDSQCKSSGHGSGRKQSCFEETDWLKLFPHSWPLLSLAPGTSLLEIAQIEFPFYPLWKCVPLPCLIVSGSLGAGLAVIFTTPRDPPTNRRGN